MRFLKFQPKFGHAVSHCPMQQILPKIAQTCPNLPKSAQRRKFEIPPKIEILVLFKNRTFYV
jgi:hypothetical protein